MTNLEQSHRKRSVWRTVAWTKRSVVLFWYAHTVEPVLSGHSKIDKTKVLKTNGSLMNVEILQNALLGHSAILLTCIK